MRRARAIGLISGSTTRLMTTRIVSPPKVPNAIDAAGGSSRGVIAAKKMPHAIDTAK
jgi:hypothetical protein